MNKERSAFSFEITDEQLAYVKDIVEYSIANHKIKDIFEKQYQYKYRTTGSLGEVCFADIYNLPRPTKSYGAIDGQDMGKDFVLNDKVIDVKSQERQNEYLYDNYVLNVPVSQLEKEGSETEYYCHISISQNNGKWRAAVIGYVHKDEILSGKIGKRYNSGASRQRANKTGFNLTSDIYEVPFADLNPPIITDLMRELPGFRKITIYKSKKYENKNS